MRKDDVYVLHLTNHLTHKAAVSSDGDSVLKETAETNCPRMFQVVKQYKIYI